MHDTNLLEDQPIAWTPTPDVIERAKLTKFMKQVGVSTWDELYEFSIRDVEKFTEKVLKFLDIKFDPPYSRLLDTSNGPEFPRWLATATSPEESEIPNPKSEIETAGLNITTMCLDRWQTDEMKDQPAVIWEPENGDHQMLTYKSLHGWVEIFSAAIRSNGLKKGDAICVHLPMMWETVVCLLAVNRIGAIAVPVFSGYGVDAIASRINAVEAKALITTTGFRRRGKWIDAITTAKEAVLRCKSIKQVYVMDNIGEDFPEYWAAYDTAIEAFAQNEIDHFAEAAVISIGDNFRRTDADYNLPGGDHVNQMPVSAEPTSAEDPLIILYTSGTTGKPKGIAHTHASFPIKAAQDMAFGTDVGKGTRISWYTDIGWMMGPWLIYGALINGATICIYDGAPDYPTPDRMWEFCAKHKVEVLGISPTLIRSLAASEESSPPYEGGVAAASADGVVLPRDAENHPPAEAVPLLRKDGSSKAPFERHDLSSLRIFASTGEPWNPAPWWWLFEQVGNSKLPIINYSGGTEIAGGILMGNPLLPIKPCSFPAPCPGMDVDILDDEGNPVGPGKVGELVIKQPWIGMARGFWQEKERYLETYWRRFKDTWVHGDFAMRDKDGHWFILGRSDDTLKVAGKRVGPAEVESILVAHPLVTEAAVIGVPDEVKGTAMVAFVVTSGEGRGTRGTGRVTSDKDEAASENVASNNLDDSHPSGSTLVTPNSSHAVSYEKDKATEENLTSNTEDEFELKSSSLVTLHSSLEAELRSLVAKDMGKPLAPSKIHFVSALPKTRNAKVMRRVIRSAYLGEDPGDLSALENPGTVEEIRRVSE